MLVGKRFFCIGMKISLFVSSLLVLLLMGGRAPGPLDKGLFQQSSFTADSIARMEERLTTYKYDIPEDYKLSILIALSFYPELQDVEIEFVYQPLKTTMAARPVPASVFQRKGHRSYRIFINSGDDCEIPLRVIPFNARIGIVGHELAHILDYEQQSGPGIMGTGMSYATARTKANFEKRIDELTISKGLGVQLHEWSDFALNHSQASEAYKAFKAETYLQPQEILARLEVQP